MNTKSMICSHCNTRLKIGVNCRHEQDLSLLCGKCGKIVYPVNEKQELTVTRSNNKRNYVTAFGEGFFGDD
jgi:RNase P subunit RPR2